MVDHSQDIATLRTEIANRAKVIKDLPDGHPVRTQYLDDIEHLEADARSLETRGHVDRWARGSALVAVAIVVAASGVPTGVMLGGFLVVVAAGLIADKW